MSAIVPGAKPGKVLGQVNWEVFTGLARIQALLPGCNHHLGELNHVQSIKASSCRGDGMTGS